MELFDPLFEKLFELFRLCLLQLTFYPFKEVWIL